VRYSDPSGNVSMSDEMFAISMSTILSASLSCICTYSSYIFLGKEDQIGDTKYGSDFLKNFFVGAVLGCAIGVYFTGVAPLLSLIAIKFMIASLIMTFALYLSEYMFVGMGITGNFSIGSEIYIFYDWGIILNPNGFISINHNNFTIGFGTEAVEVIDFRRPSMYTTFYPNVDDESEISSSTINAGGSINTQYGSFGVDFGFDNSDNNSGFESFSIVYNPFVTNDELFKFGEFHVESDSDFRRSN